MHQKLFLWQDSEGEDARMVNCKQNCLRSMNYSMPICSVIWQNCQLNWHSAFIHNAVYFTKLTAWCLQHLNREANICSRSWQACYRCRARHTHTSQCYWHNANHTSLGTNNTQPALHCVPIEVTPKFKSIKIQHNSKLNRNKHHFLTTLPH